MPDVTDKETINVELYFSQGDVLHMLQPSGLSMQYVQLENKELQGRKKGTGKPRKGKDCFLVLKGKQGKRRWLHMVTLAAFSLARSDRPSPAAAARAGRAPS